jgi:hypothetical protein
MFRSCCSRGLSVAGCLQSWEMGGAAACLAISPLFAPPNAALGVAAPKCRGLHRVTNVADRGSAGRMGKTGSWARRRTDSVLAGIWKGGVVTGGLAWEPDIKRQALLANRTHGHG